MIVFSREVFACKCSTDVPRDDAQASGLARAMRFVSGGEAEIAMLAASAADEHNEEHLQDFRARLARGEHWMVGVAEGRVVTYTWLHHRDTCEYPYLPGCSFRLAKDTGYGYDAWTPKDLRGGGLRRRAFLEELHILREMGMAWEASYFVKHQLEGATRSLGSVGITIVPLWRVTLKRDKTLAAESLAPGDPSMAPASPAFSV